MFKKKPTIKPLAPLRSSDRRRTADQIISDYGLSLPESDPQTPEDKSALTAQHSSLRNSLLPDNVQSARFTTTHGPDLKKISGTVYVGTHPGDDARILWFKIEEVMYPSVYTLWRHPGIVPLLHTPGIVVQKMQGGADLMTPGLAGPPFPPRAKKGAVVAVASIENPSVPVAVGTCTVDVSALGPVQGQKGRAVETMHWVGDEIWSYGASGKSGSPVPEELSGWLTEEVDVNELAGQTEDTNIEDDDDGGVPLNDNTVPGQDGQECDSDAKEADTDVAGGKEMTTHEIDDAFRKAFLYGAYHHLRNNTDQANYGLVYPLTQSFVMSNLIQPFLPTFTPEETNALQIKKSSYKNIKKFIKALDKQKIIRSKERDGHEATILDIDFEDPAITGFKPYPLPKKETIGGTAAGRGDKATTTIDTADSSVGQKLTITQYFKPKEKLVPLFASANATSSSLFTSAEIRPIITAYIETENLISTTNKRLVKLNPTLANSVFDGSANLDREVQAKGSVPRDALIDRVIQSCAAYYAITRTTAAGSTTESTAKPKAGSPPKIRITLETRTGNKTATKVSGLETYSIPPHPLADELRKTCAGSTSVEQLVGSSPKHPVMEIMIQGPQRDAVVKALEKRGVRSSWVEVLDKTKKGKR